MVEYPYFPTVGKKTAAMVVDTAWFSTRAMLIPLDRMRVGINSERASHTQTPGPMAKKGNGTEASLSRGPGVERLPRGSDASPRCPGLGAA